MSYLLLNEVDLFLEIKKTKKEKFCDLRIKDQL